MATIAATTSVKYTMIGLRPGDGVQGPVLNIPVEVHPPVGRNIVATVATTAALFVLGLSSVLTTWPTPAKVILVASGALVAASLSVFGLSTHAP
jgi:hypothetical protein